MPVGLKEKRGRLGTFARQNIDSGSDAGVSAPKNESGVEKQSGTLQTASQDPTRQELAEAARLPVPTGPRHVAAANHQRNGHTASQLQPRSPPSITQASPRPLHARRHSDDRHGDLFSGSQLGENFMHSGLSTPQNEPEDSDGEPTPNARRQSGRTNQYYAKDVVRLAPNGDTAAFMMGDDGKMSVVAHGPKPRAMPLHMDGFQDDAVINERAHLRDYVADRNYPSSDLPLQSALPVRQVRVRNLPAASLRPMPTRREVGSPTPSGRSALWQGQRTGDEPRRAIPGHDSDEELDSVSVHGDPRFTSDLPDVRVVKPPPAGFKHANVAQQRLPKDRKRRRPSADYDDKILGCMTYNDLLNEPFDMDPARTTGQNGHDAFSKLPLKLEQYGQQGPKEQHQMFSTMSMDDWETSGEWFVDQFTDIMTRLRDARRSKRRVIQDFENEAAAREEAVRLRSETIDRKLARMRQDGQRVVEDKIL